LRNKNEKYKSPVIANRLSYIWHMATWRNGYAEDCKSLRSAHPSFKSSRKRVYYSSI